MKDIEFRTKNNSRKPLSKFNVTQHSLSIRFPLQFNEQLKTPLFVTIQLSVDYLVKCHVDKDYLYMAREYKSFYHQPESIVYYI